MKKSYAALMAFLLAACYPKGPEFVEDADVVYTSYDTQYNFKAQKTFAMPDKIVVDVKIFKDDTIYVYMQDVYAAQVLSAIRKNMESMGWTYTTLDKNPDVVLTPAGLSSTTYFYSYWYDWWYGGYWGWYYPPYYTVSSYTTGTLFMVIADPGQAAESPIGKSPALWVGALNGLLTYGNTTNRVSTGINQAFAQSPYLKIN